MHTGVERCGAEGCQPGHSTGSATALSRALVAGAVEEDGAVGIWDVMDGGKQVRCDNHTVGVWYVMDSGKQVKEDH